jgi:hypothetical protein
MRRLLEMHMNENAGTSQKDLEISDCTKQAETAIYECFYRHKKEYNYAFNNA